MQTNKSTHWERFADFGAFLERVTTGERKLMGRPGDRNDLGSEKANEHAAAYAWTFGANWTQTLKLASEGWREGAERAGKIAMALSDKVASRTTSPAIAYDVCGDFVDVGRFCDGVPECMGFFHEVESPAKGKTVRVLVNLGVRFNQTADEMFQRGATAIALCEALERAGRSVEIIGGGVTSSGSNPLFAMSVIIKRAGDMIDADRLAFMLCHPAVHRRLGFALREMQSDKLRAKIGDGYGNSENLEAADADADIVVPFSTDDKWIFDTLRAQGVEIAD